MKTPAAMQNADGCVAVLFFSRVPASFPLFLVPLSFTFEKHGLSLVVNCLIDSLFYRQSYFKKVVEQCVVILAITWLDFKILISTSYFQPGEILIGTDARLQRRFPLKSNRKEKKTAKNLSQINNQIVQSLLNSLANSLPNLVLNSVVSLTPHTFTNAAQPFMLC